MADNPRRSYARHSAPKWGRIRTAVQVLALLLFLASILAAHPGGWRGDLANLSLRLDPLVVLAHLLASRVFLAGSALALLVLLLTLIFGRAWCSWLCPLGTILDLLPLRRASRSAPPPDSWRGIKYGLLLVLLTAALLGNLTLLVLDPLTLLVRSLGTALLPAIDRLITSLETALFGMGVSDPLVLIDGWLRPALLPSTPVYYRSAWVYAAVFFLVIGLNRWAPRFWCRYLCPLGALLGLISKAALVQRRVTDDCKSCRLCTQACPTATIDPQRNYASDPGECTLCLDCLDACPRGGLSFRPRPALAAWNTYNPGRRQALLSIGAALGGLALLASDGLRAREHPHRLRPPGGRENGLDEKCIRCGLCVRACPTGGLQPAIAEAGLEGLWTPVLVPRLGYCDYSCTTCSQVCPVEAIPRLSLEEKRVQVIGKAYIDANRCLAWNDRFPCIVCEEMCPLPEKAIWLQESGETGPDGEIFALQLPVVDRTLCIGCGICEYKCPVNGQAAIRVFIPEGETPV